MVAAHGEELRVEKADPQQPGRPGASRVMTGRAGLWLWTGLGFLLNLGRPLLLLGKAVAGRLLLRGCSCGLLSPIPGKSNLTGRIWWRLAAKNCGGSGGRLKVLFRLPLPGCNRG